MKKNILFLILFLATISISHAQNRAISRGAVPGELYLTTFWYGISYMGPPFYDTLRTAVYRITENGKKVTIQYDVDYFSDYYTPAGSVMQPQSILADATPGVLYVKRTYMKSDYYDYTQLWVSFDYGKNWVFREENKGSQGYFAVNVEGLIYRAYYTFWESLDYAYTFSKIDYGPGGSEPGLQNGEGFSLWFSNRLLRYSHDFGETYIEIPIDEEYIFGQVNGGPFPDIYRGGAQGEVYIDSWFPEYPGQSYKASFSADTGHTFRHVYIYEHYPWNIYSNFGNNQLLFMSDREPSVFYILHLNDVKDTEPYGWHLELCIEYYRDYGETLVDIYCHDINKNYKNNTCEPVNDLTSEKINNNSILLTWTEPEGDLEIDGYSIFRNDSLLTEERIINTFYLDENLPNGEYEYYVVNYYINGCISDSSNHAKETIKLGIIEIADKFTIFPNPTTGELSVFSYQISVESIELFDVYGRKLNNSQFSILNSQLKIDISHLQAGIYFVKITTEKSIITKKIIKY